MGVPSTLRAVALGGGTGLPIVLRALRAMLFPSGWQWVPARDGDRLTAVVTVADDGGSSGRLRRAYRVLAPGDIRNCLLALADGDPTLAEVFNFRFNGGARTGLTGHSLGNLILMALSQLEHDFPKAVERAGQLLRIRGRVLPSTPDDVRLLAEYLDGTVVHGQSRIAAVHRAVRRVHLEPGDARALPQAREALSAADLVLIGPGSLYTSLLPVLLVKGLAEAIARSKARVVLVMNLMTEPGETDGYTAADVVLAVRRHVPRLPIHDVLLNARPVANALVERYRAEDARPVPARAEDLRALGCRPIERDLLGTGPLVHHDPRKLAHVLRALAAEIRE